MEDGSVGKVSLQYDRGDRVEKLVLAGSSSSKVIYDGVFGCIKQIGNDEFTERNLQRFWHDARGKLKQLLIVKNEVTVRVTFHYDHLSRLIAWSETRSDGKTTDKKFRQYFYSDVRNSKRYFFKSWKIILIYCKSNIFLGSPTFITLNQEPLSVFCMITEATSLQLRHQIKS